MLCQTAIVYSRKIGDTVYDFGHEGILYRRSFIMYDTLTNSKWVHTTGEAVQGKAKGKVLTFLPSTVMSWKHWKSLHPRTTVLTGKKAKGFMGRFNLAAHPERYGLSVGQGARPKLYPYTQLMKDVLIEDAIDGVPVIVVFDAASGAARAYERGKRSFKMALSALTDERGATWSILLGSQHGGEAKLTPVPATPWLTDRWRGFFPKGAVYATESAVKAKPTTGAAK